MNEDILLPASRATAISNANVKKLTVDKILSKISSTIKLRASDGDRDALSTDGDEKCLVTFASGLCIIYSL